MASSEAKSVDTKIRNHENSADPNQIVLKPAGREVGQDLPALRDNAQSDEQFPTNGLGAQDRRDALMSAKLSSQTDKGVTPFGVLQATDSDFEWLRKKRETEAEANFQAWFAENFDKMSPTQKKLAKEMFPRFYSQRVEQLNRSVKLQAKLAKLKLLGIEDKDDLLLQYAAEAGYIDADPLEHILHPEKRKAQMDADWRKARYKRGLLNPNRLLRGDWGLELREKNAKALTGRDQPKGSAAWELGESRGFSAAPGGNRNELFKTTKEQLEFMKMVM